MGAGLFGLLAVLVAADGDHSLTMVSARWLPPLAGVTVHKPDDPKPVAVSKTPADPIPLPGGGPWDVFVNPKGGLPVRVAAGLKVTGRHELKLADVLGTVEVYGDNLPRAATVVLTDLTDPGPSENGHVPVQTVSDYREPLLVPAGTYAVWVVPANGARAVKAFANVRVQAGRSVRAE